MSVIYALLQLVPPLIFIGAMIWGFKIAGRKTESVPLQMVLGVVLGFGILIGVVCVLCGVLFAGCLIAGSPSFH
jgi:hypothetical protein